MKKYVLFAAVALASTPAISYADNHAIDDSLRIILSDTVIISTQIQGGRIAVDDNGVSIDLRSKNKNKSEKDVIIEEDEITSFEGLDELVNVFSKKRRAKKLFKVDLLMMDIGWNGFIDKTDYAAPTTQAFVRTAPATNNEKLFDLKASASRNFNLWPVIFSLKPVHTRNQKVLISSGIGVQWYNFKFNNNPSFVGGSDPHVLASDLNLTKNKLGITYASIPLMLTAQTRISKRHWLTYGVGVIGGYRISSWTNQKSKELGKVKEHDPFNLNPFQVSLTGEFGVTNVIRFYGTYQLTNMWQDALIMQPFAIGIRIFGI